GQLIDDIAANAGALAEQDGDDFHPSRVREGLRQRSQLLIRKVTLDGPKVRRPLSRRTAGLGGKGGAVHRIFPIARRAGVGKQLAGAYSGTASRRCLALLSGLGRSHALERG